MSYGRKTDSITARLAKYNLFAHAPADECLGSCSSLAT